MPSKYDPNRFKRPISNREIEVGKYIQQTRYGTYRWRYKLPDGKNVEKGGFPSRFAARRDFEKWYEEYLRSNDDA